MSNEDIQLKISTEGYKLKNEFTLRLRYGLSMALKCNVCKYGRNTHSLDRYFMEGSINGDTVYKITVVFISLNT